MRQILQTPDEMRIVNPYRYGGGGGSPYAALLAAIDASSPTLEYNALREYLAGNYADSDPVPTATEWVSGTYPATQVTAANQPTFIASANGGHPAFRFDGNDYLDVGGFSYSQPNTIIVVFQITSAVTSQIILDANNTTRHSFGITSGTWYANAGGTSITGGSQDMSAHCAVVVFDAASSSVEIDGVVVASGNPGSDAITGITISARASTKNFNFIGDMQIGPLVYDTPPTSGQIEAIEQALEDLGYVTIL